MKKIIKELHKKVKKVLVEKNILDKLLKNTNLILKGQKKLFDEEKKIEIMEEKDLQGDVEIEMSEEQTFQELKKIEKELKENQSKPLKKITKKDLLKGFIGAFFGIMGHFAFYKGIGIAEDLSMLQATVLYIVAFIIITTMLYYTGFRKIERKMILQFMPLRASILYGVSIASILLVMMLFGKLHFPIDFGLLYKTIGAIIILAVIGAGTADLIGKSE